MSGLQSEKIGAVIFDLGNTLALPDWPRIAAVSERTLHLSFDGSELQNHLCRVLIAADRSKSFLLDVAEGRVLPGWEFRRLYSELGLEDSQILELVSALQIEHQKEHLWSALNVDAVPVLDELKRKGIKLSVISNSPDGRVEELLDHLKIIRYFELYTDSYRVGFAKPDPRIFAHTVRQLNVNPRGAVYVGDSYEQDVAGAQHAGLLGVLYDPLNIQPRSDVMRIRNLRELTSRWKERMGPGQ